MAIYYLQLDEKAAVWDGYGRSSLSHSPLPSSRPFPDICPDLREKLKHRSLIGCQEVSAIRLGSRHFSTARFPMLLFSKSLLGETPVGQNGRKSATITFRNVRLCT